MGRFFLRTFNKKAPGTTPELKTKPLIPTSSRLRNRVPILKPDCITVDVYAWFILYSILFIKKESRYKRLSLYYLVYQFGTFYILECKFGIISQVNQNHRVFVYFAGEDLL
jgi:hypothetical protein